MRGDATMAEACTICNCIPYENICCCPPQAGVSVLQPKCQLLNAPCGGSNVVNNPCYCQTTNTSTWTYKFFTDCTSGNTVSAISNFLIPICSQILSSQVIVEEKIDTCGQFNSVNFTLSTIDGNFGVAPANFQWLKVENTIPGTTEGRYGKGVCVVYRITIIGNYAPVNQSIRVKAGTNFLTFCTASPCFLVPGCNPGVLTVNKSCNSTVTGNTGIITYTVTVTNTGASNVNNILFTDVLNLDGITPGTVTVVVSPPLSFNAATNTISGNIGTLTPTPPGNTFTANYTVILSAFTQSGIYVISNTATATGTTTTGTVSGLDIENCEVSVAQVSAFKSSTVTNGNEVTFRLRFSTVVGSLGNSPATNITVTDTLVIPSGVTVEITSLGNCTAVNSLGAPVVVPATIIGPETLTITCTNINVPANGGFIDENIMLTILSTSTFQTPVEIVNTIANIVYNTTNQVVLAPIFENRTAAISVLGTTISGNEYED